MSMLPRPVTGQLQVYLAHDGNVWSVNPADGRAYQVGTGTNPVAPPVGGVPDAPADGGTYGRQDNQWTPIPPVPTAQLVITTIQPVKALENSSVTITVKGTGFTPNSEVNWGGYPLTTTFIDNTTLEGTVTLGPG